MAATVLAVESTSRTTSFMGDGWRDSQRVGRGEHRRAESLNSQMNGAARGVNRISAGVNSSNAVGPAAVYELLMSSIVDTNLNIGAQGPYWAVVRPPRSYSG